VENIIFCKEATLSPRQGLAISVRDFVLNVLVIVVRPEAIHPRVPLRTPLTGRQAMDFSRSSDQPTPGIQVDGGVPPAHERRELAGWSCGRMGARWGVWLALCCVCTLMAVYATDRLSETGQAETKDIDPPPKPRAKDKEQHLPGDQAKRTKTIPLVLTYSTSLQKGLKRVEESIPESLREKIAEWFTRWAKVGASDVFLVRGNDFGDVLEATRWAMDSWIPAGGPVRRMDVRDVSQQMWLFGYLGVGRHSPPAWILESIEIDNNNIRLIYRQKPSRGEKDLPYLVWAPLGKLQPGCYTVQLYDKDSGESTLARRVFVSSSAASDTKTAISPQDAGKRPPRKVPLETIYTTGGQKGLRALPDPYSFPRGPSNMFLVRGEDVDDAIAATTSILAAGEPVVSAVGTGGVRSNKIWLAAYFGTAGSGSPWIVTSLEIQDRRICLHYRQLDGTSNDLHQYLIWAPLGQLPAATYTLELVDDDRDTVTLSRRVLIPGR
jgi:hypothetical protein